MSGCAFYHSSMIKRTRATKAEVEARRAALFEIVATQQPMTVRQAFYRATVIGLVDKTEAAYAKVQTDLVIMRRSGALPYEWLADSTRWMRKPCTFGGIEEALKDCARHYRKALWRGAKTYVELWLEKDALSGVIYPITDLYDVPLMVARGYASLSFLHSAAEAINKLEVPAYIYHLGDFDPSGVNAAQKIEETLRELAPCTEIFFERIAVTEPQIAIWRLPTRPTKQTDSRAKSFGAFSVELDAIEPDLLRNLVQRAIEQHLQPEQFAVLKAAEESERQGVAALVRAINAGDAP
jgi:hypothetical protein